MYIYFKKIVSRIKKMPKTSFKKKKRDYLVEKWVRDLNQCLFERRS